MNFWNEKNEAQTISYYNLRKAVGLVGILLPLILIFGNLFMGKCNDVQESISAYYFTPMGNYLVGSLCAVAFFLICYRGPERVDTIVSNVAAVCALGIAFFPTNHHPTFNCGVDIFKETNKTGLWHNIFAGLFFGILALMSMFLFTRTDKKKHEKLPRNKQIKNMIYKSCGITILLCIVFMLLKFEFGLFENASWKPIFTFETIALFAFGISWLVKGDIILKDKVL